MIFSGKDRNVDSDWLAQIISTKIKYRSEASLIVPILPFLCKAVHVIITFLASFTLLYFLFLFIRIPQKGWDTKKKLEKEKAAAIAGGQGNNSTSTSLIIIMISRCRHERAGR